MTFESVHGILTGDLEATKEIRLDDGRKYRVRNREEWLTAPQHLIVLEPTGHTVYFPYREIASIRVVRANHRRRKAR